MEAAVISLAALLGWGALWGLGGIWLARGAFRLPAHEETLVGLAVGFLAQNWLVNALARFIPLPWVAWVGAGLTLAGGAWLAWRQGGGRALRAGVNPVALAVFAFITLVYYLMGRGLAIFDDFAHLPTVSLMAAGDIPPHFSFDPQVLYGYHHFLLLFSAQSMRVAGLAPWVGIDVGRAVAFGLAVTLGGLWAWRLTGSRIAGVLGGAMLAFGSGSRWLLLLAPHKVVAWLSRGVEMIGSGAGSGENLAAALIRPWAVEGAGPLAFPFAFANGIFPAGVILGLTANGLVPYAVILTLLLTASRWKRTLPAALLTVVVFSSWGLLTEAELVIFLGGWGIIAAVWALRYKSLRLPASLWRWLGVIAVGALAGFLAGGAWTDLIFKFVERLTTGVSAPSYQTVGFTLAAPAVVSSHLGVLWLLNPAQALLALLELGPVLLALPLVGAFGLKAWRAGRWYEAATAAAAYLALAMVLVQFTGSTGVRNTPRLYVFMPICAVMSVPLVWRWAARRSQTVRAVAAALALAAMTGGMVMFGIALIAIQHPVYSYFIGPADAQMYQAYWNRLDDGALVFDPQPARGTTVLGRFTDAAYTWYQMKPAWEQLRAAPDPAALRAAGFRYLYLDERYWNDLSPELQQRLQYPCVRVINETQDSSGFRRLFDVGQCDN